MRWVSESVNSLLPVAQVGGDLLRGQLLHRTGVPGAVAAAGIIVNLSLAAVSLVFFICIGGALLLLKGTSAEMVSVMVIGLGLGAIGAALFIVIQRSGALVWVAGFLARQTSSSVWQQLAGQATELNLALTMLYRDRRALSGSFGWQLVAWVLGAVETWLAARWLGQPISVADSILIESLTQAVRNAAFVVPGALGIQEGGLLLIAPLAGLTPATGLAISLLKRARDLLLGVPGLVLAYLAFSHRGAR
jgi:putative membrane protein